MSVILFIAALSLIFYLVGSQVSNLASDWPKFQEQLGTSIDSLQNWIAGKYGIDTSKQLNYFHSATTKIMASGTAVVGTTFLSVSSTMLFLIFTLIDTFFMLVYRGLIMKFLVSVFKKENDDTVHAIVQQVQLIIRKYIGGLLLEMTLVAVIVAVTFLILGISMQFYLA
jgi:putative permease